MPPLSANEPGVVAITGLGSFLGSQLVGRLLERGVRVVGLDRRRPDDLDARVAFHSVDLCDPTSHSRLAEAFSKEGVEAVAHAAFRSEPTADPESDHELEAIGSLHVTLACASARVPRLVVPSTTMVYGARSDNPNYLDEEHPLRGHDAAHSVCDRVEVESLLEGFREQHPSTEVSVLRACWVLGPRSTNLASRYFSLPLVPVPLGYDPLLQFLHEEDWLDAFEAAVTSSCPGTFNLVAPGVLPLSTLLRLAGRRTLPLPSMLLDRLAYLPSQSQTGDSPAAFYDYLRHLWVADGRRGWERFGEPSYSTKETWMSFVSAQRMGRYR